MLYTYKYYSDFAPSEKEIARLDGVLLMAFHDLCVCVCIIVGAGNREAGDCFFCARLKSD